MYRGASNSDGPETGILSTPRRHGALGPINASQQFALDMKGG
jgi:hypothetical protein